MRFLDDTSQIGIQCNRQPKDGFKRWLSQTTFHIADHLLGKPRTLGYGVFREPAPLPLITKQADNLNADRVKRFVGQHDPLLRNKILDNILHSSYLVGMFFRRIGPDPHANGARTHACSGCPDIWELEDGDFAVIGTDLTEATKLLPPSASCGPDERMVRIPRKTLVLAKPDIPDQV